MLLAQCGKSLTFCEVINTSHITCGYGSFHIAKSSDFDLKMMSRLRVDWWNSHAFRIFLHVFMTYFHVPGIWFENCINVWHRLSVNCGGQPRNDNENVNSVAYGRDGWSEHEFRFSWRALCIMGDVVHTRTPECAGRKESSWKNEKLCFQLKDHTKNKKI